MSFALLVCLQRLNHDKERTIMKFKKLLSAALVAGSMLAAGAASAFPTFNITPSVYGGPAGSLTGDKFNGDYREIITFGTTALGVTPFDVSIRFIAATLANTNNGDAFTAAQTGLGVNYAIYGLYVGHGDATTSGPTTSFSQTSGSLKVFVDPGSALLTNPDAPNTTFDDPLTGASFFTTHLATGIDDQQIASGSLVSGSGSQTLPCSNNNCGSFGQTTTFALQNSGPTYFTSPVPFYNISFQTGQFNGIPVVSGGRSIVNGSLDVEFNRVPEPTTIVLFGFALLGLGVARRRKF